MGTLHEISGCSDPNRLADVVFVHGPGKDAFGTWRYGNDESTSWPHQMAKEFPKIGVWSGGYEASPTTWLRRLKFWRSFSGRLNKDGQGMALPNQSRQILDLMRLDKVGQRPIFWIGHSLGGLVIKQVLQLSKDSLDIDSKAIFDNTKAVLFLATPHAGADIASLLSNFKAAFGATITLEGLRAHDAHLATL